MTEDSIGPLYYRKTGAGDPVLILHGLFGSGDNWHRIARELSGRYEVFAVDLRNHGKSPHSSQFDYNVMSDDLIRFVRHHHLDGISLIGHSMGGKAAMQFAFSWPDSVRKLVVVDIAPKAYAASDRQVIDALASLDLSMVSRLKDADEMLQAAIGDDAVRLFLLKNLKREKDGTYRWQINVDAIRTGYKRLASEVTGTPFEKPCLFIRGEHSDYILDSDWPDILEYFPKAKLVTIPGAGHWVHTDAPEAFIQAVLTYFKIA